MKARDIELDIASYLKTKVGLISSGLKVEGLIKL